MFRAASIHRIVEYKFGTKYNLLLTTFREKNQEG